MNDTIKQQIDKGATLLYSHGGVTDSHMMKGGTMDVIAQMVEAHPGPGRPRRCRRPLPQHANRVLRKHNVGNDFYVKTFHIDRYWSATPEDGRVEYDWMKRSGEHDRNHDSMWCNDPEETAAFMEKVEKPWVAFKVMAAGAINPQIAFPYAYKNGADFVIAGMFDFQVETDVQDRPQSPAENKEPQTPLASVSTESRRNKESPKHEESFGLPFWSAATRRRFPLKAPSAVARPRRPDNRQLLPCYSCSPN